MSILLPLLILCLLATTGYSQADADITIQFASSNTRYAQDFDLANARLPKTWKGTGWKGEKLHTQLLVASSKDLATVSVRSTALTGSAGTIPAANVKLGYIGYVVAGGFVGCAPRDTSIYADTLAADPIDFKKKAIALKKGQLQPLWLSVEIPQHAQAGTYHGTVELVNGSNLTRLPYRVEVQNNVLPAPAAWSYHLDLWQHPAAIARVENLPLWSDAHFEAMRPYYEMLAKAGQKIITTAIIDEPWGHQTYDDFPSVIKWIKKSNGTWEYDYSLFDKYVEFVMSCGIGEQINCYTMVPWSMKFAYYDEAAGRDTTLVANPGTPEYNAHWGTFLKSFEQHLKQKGWFEKTVIAMDERPLEAMKHVLALVKGLNKDWKVSIAANSKEIVQIENQLFEFSPAMEFKMDSAMLADRQNKGYKTTFYTCCAENYPNGFSFSPPAESTFLAWYAYSKGYDGYLRWAYNSWPQNPYVDSRFVNWSGGDTYQVYPFANTSIRFEKMIEGIQDFEKLKIIEARLKENNQTAALQELKGILAEMTVENVGGESAEALVQKGKDFIQKTN